MSNVFHDIADQMESLAQDVRDLGDSVHLGTYTVGETPPAEEETPPEASKSSGSTAKK